MLQETVKVNGIRWGFCFLLSDTKLSYDDRLALIRHAAEMHFGEEKERVLQTNAFWGRIFTQGRETLVGSFGGREYGTDLHTHKGKVEVRFLIREYKGPSLPVHSVN